MKITKRSWFFHNMGLLALVLVFGVMLVGCQAITIGGAVLGGIIGGALDHAFIGVIVGFIIGVIVSIVLGNKLSDNSSSGSSTSASAMYPKLKSKDSSYSTCCDSMVISGDYNLWCQKFSRGFGRVLFHPRDGTTIYPSDGFYTCASYETNHKCPLEK